MTVALPPNDSSGLATQLWRLANFIRDNVKEAKSRGDLVETTETCVRRKIAKFDYKDGGAITLNWTNEFVESPRWHWKHQQQFTESVIKPSSAFQECAEILEKDTSPGASGRNMSLDQFVQAIAAEARDECSDEQLVEYIARFTRDLSNASVEMRVSAWVEGVWLKDESISLGNLKLRRPTPRDLENEQPLSVAVNFGFQPSLQSSNSPAIAEFSIKACSAEAAQEEVALLMGALRLYRLGSVHAVSYSVFPDSLTRFSTTHGAAQQLHASNRFPLGSGESEALALFIGKIKPLLPPNYDETSSPPQPADLGFVRFSDAALKWGDVDGRITAAITCLEALFLKGRERSELAHKLSLRVACLLRLLKSNPIEVQGNVHQAYDIRSTYIHGGQVETERLRNAQELCLKVLEYARLSTVIFLQLKGVIEKDEFLSKLDRALLDPKSLERIEKQLKEFIIPQ